MVAQMVSVIQLIRVQILTAGMSLLLQALCQASIREAHTHILIRALMQRQSRNISARGIMRRHQRRAAAQIIIQQRTARVLRSTRISWTIHVLQAHALLRLQRRSSRTAIFQTGIMEQSTAPGLMSIRSIGIIRAQLAHAHMPAQAN